MNSDLNGKTTAVSFATSLIQRVQSYWFAPGGGWSHAFCRIGVGVCLWWVLTSTWQPNWEAYVAAINPEVYRPIGLNKILGSGVPHPTFLLACQWVAYVSAWMVMVGFLTRLSFVVCTGCMWILLSMPWCCSFGEWCHGHNTILLVALAMMFGRSSPLSVDALLKRWWRGPAAETEAETGHRWPVMLGQFAVAFMFANAAFWKLYHPNEPFAVWAFSDNLRNHLILQYWVLHQPMPEWLEWVVGHPWACQLMALGNLVTQLLPLLACFLVRWPLLRALVGLAVVLETFMLGRVMGLHNPHWYVLFVLFVDWDRLVSWLGAKLGVGETANADRSTFLAGGSSRSIAPALWVAAFVGFYLYVGFFHKGQRRYTYPFTAWPLYCGLAAERPYGEHHPYTISGTTWTIESEPPLPKPVTDYVWSAHWNFARAWPETHETLTQIKNQLEQTYRVRITRLVLEKTSYQIQPHPDTKVKPCRTAIACLWQKDGFRGLEADVVYDNQRGKHFMTFTPHGLTQPSYQIGHFPETTRSWQPLSVEQMGDRYYFDKPPQKVFFFAVRVKDAAMSEEESMFTPCLSSASYKQLAVSSRGTARE